MSDILSRLKTLLNFHGLLSSALSEEDKKSFFRFASSLETDIRHALREKGQLANALFHQDLPSDLGLSTFDEKRVEAQLLAADASWNEDIVEPDSLEVSNGASSIDLRIRQGLGWTWEKPYVKNGQFSWCGAEAAWCLKAAGLKVSLRKKVMPSCFRLWDFCHKNDDGKRCITDFNLAQPGDILVVGNSDSPRWGSHITTILSSFKVSLGDVESFYVHEGNAKAYGPRRDVPGYYREGVGRQDRPARPTGDGSYHAMFIYRFLPEDYVSD